MPFDRIAGALNTELAQLKTEGRAKGAEKVLSGIIRAKGAFGPRYVVAGEPGKEFIRMNSNGYLGLAGHPKLLAAEEQAVRTYGAGPGAVRFISGTWQPHVDLEKRLAAFHGRDAAMIFSSAYATVMGVLPPLVTSNTGILSDSLNHNCIINATRLAHPKMKSVYDHLDLGSLEKKLAEMVQTCSRIIIVTDGVFSMRGDHAPLDEIAALARQYDQACDENVILLVDDSHGVGAFGPTGRGTEEETAIGEVDVLVGTLGKAFGVNGGYVVGLPVLVDYLRQTSPFYIYSNPITPGEAAAACAAVDLVDSNEGRGLLHHLRDMTERFETGLGHLNMETIKGKHPVVPLMVRETEKTASIIEYLFANGVLATGLNYPVVPKGDEEIRFQIAADHTANDIDTVLEILDAFPS